MFQQKKYATLFLFFSFLFIILGCDKIDEPYKELKNVCETDLPAPTTAYNSQRTVLLEDFTGFYCGNCPAAHRIAQDLYQEFGEKLLILSIHAGYLAEPNAKHTYDFRTPTGNEIDALFGVSAQGVPRGLINRRSFDGQKALLKERWRNAIENQLAESPSVGLQINSTFDAETRKLNIRVDAQYLKAVTDAKHRLAIYIAEDSVINFQKQYNPDMEFEDYAHRHVLRTAVNGTWGQAIATGDQSVGQSYTLSECIDLPAGWNADKCEIVATVLEDADKAVLQAAKRKATAQP